jgi:hypothetical protein
MNPLEQLLRELLRQLLEGTGAEVEVNLRIVIRASKKETTDV